MAQRLILDYLDETGEDEELEEMFQKVFFHVIKSLKKKKNYEVSLSLLNDEEQRRLNFEYRNKDSSTDVLTFAYEETKDVTLPIIDLGSITISSEVAKKQAEEYKHPFKRELAFLFIHGLLHIFGYDHIEEKDAEIMFSLQNDILNSFHYDFYTDLKKLQCELDKARNSAIATYSKFHVGAVVVTKDGNYIRGFNIENSAYPATICAERVALSSAYSQGYRKDDIVAIGCVTDSKRVGTCCGVCRQVMSELMNLDASVYLYSRDFSKHMYTSVGELLPDAFTKEDLEK